MNRGRLRAIFWKELIQMRRDRTTLRLMLLVPVMQLLIFGYAIRQDVRNLPTAVLDLSRTQESRAFVDRLIATDNFKVTRAAASYDEAIRLIDNGRVRASVVIPETFARDLKRGRSTQVQVLVDATDPTASQSAIAAAQLVGQRQNLEILSARTGLPLDGDRLLVDVRVRPLYNPALQSVLYIVPGIIGMILSNILIIVTAITIVREREQGTLEQLIVTPLTRTEIMLGKIAPYVGVGYVQMSAVLLVGHFLFHVPIRGSLLTVYAGAFVFIVASLSLGLFISTLARTQSAAIQSAFLLLLPNVLLSGFMFPREAMPAFARAIGYLLPLTYFLQFMRAVILKGVGFAALWPQLLALCAAAILLVILSVTRFHKQLD